MNFRDESMLLAERVPRSDSSLTSGARWQRIRVEYHAFSGASCFEIDSLHDHVVIVQRSGTVQLRQRRGSRWHESVAASGSVHILPAGVDSTWQHSGTHSQVRIHLQAALLTCASAQFGPAGSVELKSVLQARDPLIEYIGLMLVAELKRPEHRAQDAIVDAVAEALAGHLIRDYNALAAGRTANDVMLGNTALGRVLRHMDLTLGEPICLDALAGIAGISRFHFCRLFRQSIGLSPMVYLEHVRIQRARELITEGRMSLAQIAAAVGYADQSHFTRRFHRHAGSTPGRFARDRGVRLPRTSRG